MKRSVRARLIAATAAICLANVGAAACTVASPMTKVNSAWVGLTLGTPGGGINAGEFATLLYTSSNAPKGAVAVLQQGIKSGNAISWVQRGVPTKDVNGIMSVQAPFGRDLYRIAIKDARGKVLASAMHSIDVYRLFTLGALAGRPTQTATVAAGGAKFIYYFQDQIGFARSSCRQLTDMKLYNSGSTTRQLTITHTIGKRSSTQTVSVAPLGQVKFGPVAATPGESLVLRIDNNNTLGSTLKVFGEAYCFTANGRY